MQTTPTPTPTPQTAPVPRKGVDQVVLLDLIEKLKVSCQEAGNTFEEGSAISDPVPTPIPADITALTEEISQLKQENLKLRLVIRITDDLKQRNYTCVTILELIDEFGAENIKAFSLAGPSKFKENLGNLLVEMCSNSSPGIACVTKIVEAGAPLDHSSGDPLKTAIKNKRYQIADYLLKCGANINIDNNSLIKYFRLAPSVFYILLNDIIVPSETAMSELRQAVSMPVIVALGHPTAQTIKVATRLSYEETPEYSALLSGLTDADISSLLASDLTNLMASVSKSQIEDKKGILEKLSKGFLNKF